MKKAYRLIKGGRLFFEGLPVFHILDNFRNRAVKKPAQIIKGRSAYRQVAAQSVYGGAAHFIFMYESVCAHVFLF